jgi:hypothetical protein
MLCQHLKRELCEIELVESEELGTIGVGESTVPPFVGLIQRLGIDEQEFIRATDGTYKLGIKFVGWHQRSDSYFHPFGVIGKPIGNHDFYQCWLKARAEGNTSALQDFSPCNVMAEQGRFFHRPRRATRRSAAPITRCTSMRCWSPSSCATTPRSAGSNALRARSLKSGSAPTDSSRA